jgi:glycosyltransferase involved in cell wall biosynthesis
VKILQLVQQPQLRGAELFAHDLTTELLTRGHEVRTVYLYPAGGEHVLADHGHDVFIGANPQNVFERVPGINPAVLWKLHGLINSFQPDIVQANGARTLKYGAALRRLSFRRPFGFVYRSIGDPLVWVRGRARRAFFRTALIPAVDGIAAVSTTSLDGLRSLYHLEGKVVAQIPRGIDTGRIALRRSRNDVRSALDVDDRSPMIVCVGGLTAEKRPDRLARVFAEVVAALPTATLCVIGDGPGRAGFESLVGELSIADRVRLVGSTDDVGSYVAAADVLLLTSDTEGLPGVVLEAAALGVPSVATRVGGVADAVADGVNGLLAPPEDEARLADHVVSLLTDDALRTRLGRVAKQRFDTTYAIPVVADAYVGLYEAVVKQMRS